MKQLRNLLLIIPVILGVISCNTDDLKNDIDSLKDRVTNLEAQVQLFNENLNALRVLAEGGKTIQSYTYDETTDKYTVTLSDGSEIVLTQGTKGEATTPSITISEDGYWVINEEKQSIKAEGSDAATPKFRINSEGCWQVDLDGDGPKDFENVLGEDGKPVKATTDQSISMSDEFFESVKEENGCLVVTLKDGGKTYSLPIVENLLCEIVEPEQGFKDGVLTVGYGKTVELTVKVKGDNYAVTAPAGWTAVLGEPDAETNEAKLSLVAPAQASASSRATADNTRDLTLQVNSGLNWAIDKIQVEAKNIVESYYEEWKGGKSITIGDLTINNIIFKEAVLVETDKTITTDEESTGVYFVKPGVTLEYAGTTSSKNLIVIGDNELDNTACFKLSARLNLNMGENPAENQGYYIWKNLKFDAADLTTACMSGYRAYDGCQDKAIIIDDCEVLLPGKNFLELTTDGRFFNKFILKNSKITVKANMSFVLTKTSSATNKSDKFGEMVVENNIVYSKTPLTNVKFFNGQEAKINSIALKNNTLVNLQTTTSGYFYTTVGTNIDCANNIIYSENVAANQVVIRLINNDGSFNGMCSGNYIYYTLSGETQYNWQLFYSGKMPVTGGEQAIKLSTTPFETFEVNNGEFIPLSEYANYGAQLN